MMPDTDRRAMVGKLAACAVLAVSFAWVEVCVVAYIRKTLGIPVGSGYTGYADWTKGGQGQWVAPRILEALDRTGILVIERFREIATLVLLGAVALLVGSGARSRLGAFAFLFGIWDLAYYLGLLVAVRWPTSLFDTDIYFLLPTALVGPVWFPLLIMPVIAWLGARTLLKPAVVEQNAERQPTLTTDIKMMEHSR